MRGIGDVLHYKDFSHSEMSVEKDKDIFYGT